ncbi:MAG: hypothetical protein NWE96_04960 [Candidatus Bathyarchaeota archaeon]|nr:hypothetical protein [Candidatus Bathyarchaeota archaeon]
MTTLPKVNHRLSVLIHSLGLSCLGGAIFLQVLVFLNIYQQGYFMAIESNPYVLSSEIGLTIFTLIYFIYLYFKLMRTNLKS